MSSRGLFIFRQDLRLSDNTALLNACAQCKELIPVFIFDEPILVQFTRPDARVGFLIETVFALKKELQAMGSDLLIFHWVSTELIPLLTKELQIDAVFRNKSYGVGSRVRDGDLKNILSEQWVTVETFQDYLLVEPDQVETRKVFTPFYYLWQRVAKRLPDLSMLVFPVFPEVRFQWFEHNILSHNIDEIYTRLGAQTQSFRSREHCDALLYKIPVADYDDRRNFPSDTSGTSMLSPYLRFGLVSPRQVLARVIDQTTPGTIWDSDGVTMDKKIFKNSFVSELAWREFRRHIDGCFPEARIVAFQEKRRNIRWENNHEWFAAWKEARTGYPIVDAGMRQLSTMWRMHGRVRMIVASFLSKDLLIDWTRWEHHFAQLLIDYDAAVNMGNRQRSASVGADPKPLRIFNPILQSQKFDPNAIYIKHWLPELAHIPAVQLHDPLTYELPRHKPIVNHYETSKIARELYKGVRQEGLFG